MVAGFGGLFSLEVGISGDGDMVDLRRVEVWCMMAWEVDEAATRILLRHDP